MAASVLTAPVARPPELSPRPSRNGSERSRRLQIVEVPWSKIASETLAQTDEIS
jgi:hypothetical protein